MTWISPVGSGRIVLTLAWGIAFILACRIIPQQNEPAGWQGLTGLLIGESRQALSLGFFNKADLYFHKGVGHLEARTEIRTPFQSWADAISPRLHAHAEGWSSAEILPWLKLATETDPHNVDAFLVAAFWAESGLNRPDVAKAILDEAQRMNPGDYRIPLEAGRYGIRAGRIESAGNSIAAALRLQHATSTPHRDERQSTLDQAEMLTFLGFISELHGQRQEAIAYFNNMLAIFPERSYIKERVSLLEAGKDPEDKPENILKKLTRQSTHDACHEDHDTD